MLFSIRMLDLIYPKIFDFLLLAPILILSITLHEAAHGYAARALGDDTAERMGRISLNPLRHVDLIGTFLLPGLLLLSQAPFLFGYAKPVPVNFERLKSPHRDQIIVAGAGPAMNFFLAFLSSLALHFIPLLPQTFQPHGTYALVSGISFNIILALFNLLPLPPLDGSRILAGILPPSYSSFFLRLEKWGMLILLFIIVGLPMLGINPIGFALKAAANEIIEIILALVHIK